MTSQSVPVPSRTAPVDAKDYTYAFDSFLNFTMAGGTALVASAMPWGGLALASLPDYVSVRLDFILQYERTILELQRELLHYRRLLSRFMEQTEVSAEGPGLETVVRLDAQSIRVLNSIITARVPERGAFLDFEEGEL
jgi:hypothetical protein